MRESTLRARGFSIVKITGCATKIAHKQPFTVNSKPAREIADGFEYIIRGHYYGEIPREILNETE